MGVGGTHPHILSARSSGYSLIGPTAAGRQQTQRLQDSRDSSRKPEKEERETLLPFGEAGSTPSRGTPRGQRRRRPGAQSAPQQGPRAAHPAAHRAPRAGSAHPLPGKRKEDGERETGLRAPSARRALAPAFPPAPTRSPAGISPAAAQQEPAGGP